MKDILRYFGDPRDPDTSHEIKGQGNRFQLRMVHRNSLVPGDWSYYAYADLSPEGMATGRILPAREIPTYLAPADFYPIDQLEITDKRERNRTIDASKLVPPGWTFAAVTFKPDINRVFEQTGMVNSNQGRFYIGKLFPITPLTDTKRLCLPVYRLGQEKPGIDEAAEQIVYNIGLALASPHINEEFQEAHNYARRFTQQVLGGNLMILGAH